MAQTPSKPRSSPCKCASVAYTQYSVITGISMLDKSEAIIVSETPAASRSRLAVGHRVHVPGSLCVRLHGRGRIPLRPVAASLLSSSDRVQFVLSCADTFVIVMLLALMYYAAVFSPHFVRGIVNSARA